MSPESQPTEEELPVAATNPAWTWIVPLGALAVLGAAFQVSGTAVQVIAGVALIGAVFSAVHHAEVIAHRIGEPFGTLVLAVAVTIIEVALIVSLMMAGGPEKAGLARDTVLAAVMIAANGIVGLCLLVGGVRHREQGFQVQGASAALAVLSALAVMTLVLPNYLVATPGPTVSRSQLLFVGVISLVLYLVFVFVQTVRHRDYFLAEAGEGGDLHAPPPPMGAVLASVGLLGTALVAVVGLAKVLSPVIEGAVARAGAPPAVVGVVISALVLLPESLAALRQARANRLQNSLNLALGSALASIGLTIPAIAAMSLGFGKAIELGVTGKDTVLLALTLFVGVITLGTGRTTVLQGMVHLTIFAAYLFLAVVP
jgi:Ca2+:H+ antiporter